MKRSMLFIFIFLFLLVSVLFAQKGIRVVGKHPPELPKVVYRTGWALLVGINKYPNLPPKYQLNYAVADAEDFAKLLQRKFGFTKSNITILKDRQATKDGILNALSSFADTNRIKDQDCVLVYFSGHGQTVPLPRGGGEMGFLLPYDAKVNLSSRPNAANYYRYCIGMDELKRVAKLIPARHILFIVDACYSGLALESSRGLDPEVPGYLRKVVTASSQQMITAGGKGEMSMESADFGHGVFTYKLLQGLEKRIADWDNDGVITGYELGTYLRSVVPKAAKQTPQFRAEGEGEFLFLPQVEDEPIIIEELQSNATLVVDSKPNGAEVYVDGRRVGETPCTVQIDAGVQGRREVTVALSKEGYRTKRAKVNLIAGKQTRWTNIPLDKLPETTLPKEITHEKDGAEMVLIPAGEFQMGTDSNEIPGLLQWAKKWYSSPKARWFEDETPRHTVYLDAFYIDKYEVTVGQYKKFIKETGHQDLPDWVSMYSPTDRHPVVGVSWDDAQAYAKWAGKRLPTEAEWEKAARGGLVGKKFPWGDEDPDGTQCNFADKNTDYDWSDKNVDDGYQYTSPVGSFPPNGYGLYDMAGNVWEWCSDWYAKDYYKNSPKRSPQGPEKGSSRVCGGGSWNNYPNYLRCADRGRHGPTGRDLGLGFRLVLSSPSIPR